MLERLRSWCPWVVGIILITAIGGWVYGHIQANEAREKEHEAARLEEALFVSAGINDSLAERADSLEAERDSIASSEQAVRDSIAMLLAGVDTTILVTGKGRVRWSASLDTTLAELAREVRPGLRPLVQKAQGAKDSLDSYTARQFEAMERQAELLAADTASLLRELAAEREFSRGVVEERDSLRVWVGDAKATIAAKNAAIEAYKRLANPPWWQSLLGRDLIEAGANVTVGALVCAMYPEREEGNARRDACVSYIGANVTRFVASEISSPDI